jgi:hypothetical protein
MRKLALLSILLGASVCASANTTFVLNGVTFSDGATASGSFTINTALNALVSWSINVTGSSLSPTANYDYTSTPSDSNYFNISPTEVALASSPFAEYLVLIFNSSLGGGGTIGLISGISVDCNPTGTCGALSTGSVSVVTPEPATALLIIPMMGLLGLLVYRRASTRG